MADGEEGGSGKNLIWFCAPLLGCGSPVAIIGVLVAIMLMAALFALSGGSTTVTTDGELSSVVPTNYATLIKESAAYYKIDPAAICAVYLTEHHTDTFGDDLPSLDAVQPSCDESYAGALGPMQIMPDNWANWDDTGDPADLGITSINECRYRDSFLCGGWYIEYCVSTYCTSAGGEIVYDNDCLMDIGKCYCGSCNHEEGACSNTVTEYYYCEQVVRHYNICKTGTALLPAFSPLFASLDNPFGKKKESASCSQRSVN